MENLHEETVDSQLTQLGMALAFNSMIGFIAITSFWIFFSFHYAICLSLLTLVIIHVGKNLLVFNHNAFLTSMKCRNLEHSELLDALSGTQDRHKLIMAIPKPLRDWQTKTLDMILSLTFSLAYLAAAVLSGLYLQRFTYKVETYLWALTSWLQK